jgi:hypothetical protein
MKCCNKQIKINRQTSGEKLYWMQCESCGKKGKGKTQKDAEKAFRESPITSKIPPPAVTSNLPVVVTSKKTFYEYVDKSLAVIAKESSPVQDKPATLRMIEKNEKYIANLSGYSYDKIWKTEQGAQSFVDAFHEANYHAATMPEMGSVVPYGEIVEFIPAVECFEFLLTTGSNPPFKGIFMKPVFEKDQSRSWQDREGYHYEIQHGMPRGDIIGVIVGGTRTDTGLPDGESYDEPFLMSMAEHHSPGYKAYLIDKEDFERMRSEGNLKKDNTGREYMSKQMHKKGGGTWEKKIYEHDLKNPYDGPDKVKMLIKTAGKHFFKKFVKTRNAAAMADEWQEEAPENREQAADDVLSKAAGQFADIQDGEPIETTIITDNKGNTHYEGKPKEKNPETDSGVDDLEIEIEDGNDIKEL